jgi:ribosomal protein L37AE/L43A
MTFWIIIVLLMLGVVALAKEMRKRRVCPSCGKRGLCCIRVVRPTGAVDYRARLENSVSYYRCKFCGTNYKRRFTSKLLEEPSVEELANYFAGKL